MGYHDNRAIKECFRSFCEVGLGSILSFIPREVKKTNKKMLRSPVTKLPDSTLLFIEFEK